ncbi:DNA -binding domain-containing protein [Mesorhizobium atlanticum]
MTALWLEPLIATIATALFGHARVQADWNDPGDHLRDRIRRAVRRGQQLMNGEYRRLLV